MQPEELCLRIAKWIKIHKDENPFAFGEVHLITEEAEADILLIIGKPEEECKDEEIFLNQWEGTTYDAPVTWLWQKLANEEADEWLRVIYDREAQAMKRHMLTSLLEFFQLIESNGYEIDWEAPDDEDFCTRILINKVPQKSTFETERWQKLLSRHQTG